jgi:hypothetical protein
MVPIERVLDSGEIPVDPIDRFDADPQGSPP